jgi:hypothetical protein
VPPSVSGSMLYLAPLSDFVGNAFRSRECGVVSGTDFGKDQWLGRGSRIRSRLRISQNHQMHQVQAQALRPRDVSRPPVGSSTLPGRSRAGAVQSGTFFDCIQVSPQLLRSRGSGSRFTLSDRGGRPGRMPVSSVPVHPFFQWFLAPAHQDYPSIPNHYSPSASGLTMHQHADLDKLPDSFLMGSRLPYFMASVHKVCLLLSRCFCVIRHTGFAMHSLPCHFHCYVFSAAPNLCLTPTFRYTRYSNIYPINGHPPYQWTSTLSMDTGAEILYNSPRTAISCCWACIRVASHSLAQLQLQ